MQTLSVGESTHRASAEGVLFALGELGRAVGQRLSRQEIDGGTLHLLHLLHRLGPVRVTELAAQSRLDTSTVSRHLQGLERRGLIVRSPDPRDGRAQRVALSDDGQVALAEMTRAGVSALESALTGWSPGEVESLSRSLARLTDALHSAHVGAAHTHASNSQR